MEKAIFESLRNDIEFSAEAGLEMKYTWHINYSIIIRHNNEGYIVSYVEFGKLIDCEYGLSLDDATKALASWIDRGYKA